MSRNLTIALLGFALFAQPFVASCFGQGQVHFNNRVPPNIIAKFFGNPDGTGLGSEFTAQLFGGPAGSSQLAPLFPTTTFRSGIAAGFVVPVDVIVPGVLPGEQATLVMRAYATGYDFFTAPIFIESNPITITLGGGLFPPANLVGLNGVCCIPEPSVLSLLVIGSAALVTIRRINHRATR